MSRFLLYRKSAAPHNLFAAGWGNTRKKRYFAATGSTLTRRPPIEPHLPVDEREDRNAPTDVFSWEKFRSALANMMFPATTVSCQIFSRPAVC
jgi:hypothetical protein